jgi:DNA-3-methyladenine glycosylase I
MPTGLTKHADGARRCAWCGVHPDYVAYHDFEWGVPVRDDRLLFEKISLEGFQSGLSWLTILRKREGFRRGFANFDIEQVARFTNDHVERLLQDARLVRHRGKIESTITNARRCADLIDREGSFADYVWRFNPAPGSRPKRLTWEVLQTLAITPESVAFSRDLKKRGWSFVGPTTMYAFMQAVGLVNDHLQGCFVHHRSALL